MGIRDALEDIRQKLVEEPWYGRAVTDTGAQEQEHPWSGPNAQNYSFGHHPLEPDGIQWEPLSPRNPEPPPSHAPDLAWVEPPSEPSRSGFDDAWGPGEPAPEIEAPAIEPPDMEIDR